MECSVQHHARQLHLGQPEQIHNARVTHGPIRTSQTHTHNPPWSYGWNEAKDEGSKE